MTFQNNSGLMQSQVVNSGLSPPKEETHQKEYIRKVSISSLPEMQVPPNTNKDEINLMQFNSNAFANNPMMMNEFETLNQKLQTPIENQKSVQNSGSSGTEHDHSKNITKNSSEIHEDQTLYKMMFRSNPTNEFCEPKDQFGFDANMSGIITNNDMSKDVKLT